MRGLAILLGFQFLGTAIAEAARIPIPGNVLGLICFLIALFAGWVKVEWVEQTASLLLKHMMLFFAPLIVGTIVFFPMLVREWLPIALSLVAGTAVPILVTGLLASKWAPSEDRRRDANGG
ncbi:CidA/LrgA family protein [Paenibacillus thermotolerans]|uniref:CidA/LrgA family protein n=1 Tax=Paenibacillus thermotolerans TaxID=3027807 RepID=UPI0023681B81|nr:MULTISPECIES: CidA/LrgA family protein [unclassified Paenibacillus]